MSDLDDRLRSLDRTIQRLLAATDAQPDGMLFHDCASQITFCNRGFEKITGYMRRELIGTNLSLMIPGDVKHPHGEDMHQHVIADQSYRVISPLGDVPLVRKTGETIRVKVERFIVTIEDSIEFGGWVRPLGP